ncbi:MAG: hypothetical protein JWM25_19 [Thermoleophilia bacterium]|nr:hypothetical protein [Thermoleophilia bacterium]
MHRVTPSAAAPRDGERGQTMAEYAMVLAVITLAVLLTIIALGDAAGGTVNEVADALS